ncbi:glycoside hydrolase family 19 protein [Burkholderia ambifaria]|jgi:putative chitinase|uniref:glycoside hydrolase family 19 protein n=1 Tax=Burkholderia ambifaria TaxID=152480 RepID=UPI00158BFDAE|nr:glycoside hydrolase family 19 protein [Burkholderia ambifaria]
MDMDLFKRAAGLTDALADRWFPHIELAVAEFDITTPRRLAAWLAQMGHESGGFTQLVESFNYRIDALKIFSRVPADMRAQLGRRDNEKVVPIERQIKIANLAYGGRYGNGDVSSGDGWRYRGRGLKQVTFKDNYRECGQAIGLDLVAQPELLEQDRPAARSAGWFWKARGCNELADKGDFAGTTRAINGPAMEGQDRRKARYDVAVKVLVG